MILTTMALVNLSFLINLEQNREGFSFGKGKRPDINEGEHFNVGPGDYKINPNWKGKLGKIGSEKRHGLPLTS